MNRARRLLCGLTLIVPGAFATGCLIPYAYPKLDYVPDCDFGPKMHDVHAFRVDVSARQVDMGETGSFTLTAIEPRPDGSFPPQVGTSVERGYLVLGVALNYNVGRLHATRVRLYRPGYLLVELPAWGSTRDITWTTAPNWVAQEKAIDNLLWRPAVSGVTKQSWREFWGDGKTHGQLPETNGSTDTTRVFAFAASEYQRVAKLAPTPEDVERLHEKASELLKRTGGIDYAAKPPDVPAPPSTRSLP